MDLRRVVSELVKQRDKLDQAIKLLEDLDRAKGADNPFPAKSGVRGRPPGSRNKKKVHAVGQSAG